LPREYSFDVVVQLVLHEESVADERMGSLSSGVSSTPLGADFNVSSSSAVVLWEGRSYDQVSNLERMKRIRQIDQAILIKVSIFQLVVVKFRNSRFEFNLRLNEMMYHTFRAR